jgi:hypothetical protein
MARTFHVSLFCFLYDRNMEVPNRRKRPDDANSSKPKRHKQILPDHAVLPEPLPSDLRSCSIVARVVDYLLDGKLPKHVWALKGNYWSLITARIRDTSRTTGPTLIVTRGDIFTVENVETDGIDKFFMPKESDVGRLGMPLETSSLVNFDCNLAWRDKDLGSVELRRMLMKKLEEFDASCFCKGIVPALRPGCDCCETKMSKFVGRGGSLYTLSTFRAIVSATDNVAIAEFAKMEEGRGSDTEYDPTFIAAASIHNEHNVGRDFFQ